MPDKRSTVDQAIPSDAKLADPVYTFMSEAQAVLDAVHRYNDRVAAHFGLSQTAWYILEGTAAVGLSGLLPLTGPAIFTSLGLIAEGSEATGVIAGALQIVSGIGVTMSLAKGFVEATIGVAERIGALGNVSEETHERLNDVFDIANDPYVLGFGSLAAGKAGGKASWADIKQGVFTGKLVGLAVQSTVAARAIVNGNLFERTNEPFQALLQIATLGPSPSINKHAQPATPSSVDQAAAPSGTQISEVSPTSQSADSLFHSIEVSHLASHLANTASLTRDLFGGPRHPIFGDPQEFSPSTRSPEKQPPPLPSYAPNPFGDLLPNSLGGCFPQDAIPRDSYPDPFETPDTDEWKENSGGVVLP